MKLLHRVREDEVIAAFLRAELTSFRFAAAIMRELACAERNVAVVARPDLDDPLTNAYRRELLARVRGWGRNEGLFRGFPDEVRWYRARLDPDELRRIEYIRFDYWIEFSGGSRLASDAAARLRASPNRKAIAAYAAIADRVTAGERLPEMIVVGPPDLNRLVILEGHLRLTAYHLLDPIPTVDVFLGMSERIVEWALF